MKCEYSCQDNKFILIVTGKFGFHLFDRSLSLILLVDREWHQATKCFLIGGNPKLILQIVRQLEVLSSEASGDTIPTCNHRQPEFTCKMLVVWGSKLDAGELHLQFLFSDWHYDHFHHHWNFSAWNHQLKSYSFPLSSHRVDLTLHTINLSFQLKG